jgi:hypothetical protein
MCSLRIGHANPKQVYDLEHKQKLSPPTPGSTANSSFSYLNQVGSTGNSSTSLGSLTSLNKRGSPLPRTQDSPKSSLQIRFGYLADQVCVV